MRLFFGWVMARWQLGKSARLESVKANLLLRRIRLHLLANGYARPNPLIAEIDAFLGEI